MSMETLMHNTDPLGALLGDASDINFDNSGTDLTSDNVQGAIEELTSAENIAYDSNNSVKDMLDKQSLTITREQNSYVSTLEGCWASKIGNLLIISFNITVTGSATSDWVKIGEISGWNASVGSIIQPVAQDSTFKMVTLRVRANGYIDIFLPSAISSGTFRGQLISLT